MTIEQIHNKIASPEYGFLKTDKHLDKNIILLGLAGSHAYGTNNEGSDLDIRGCALNSKAEILTNENFEQFVNEETDTTIYSFNKLIHLLSNCNPNTIEILGLKPEHYLYVHSIGKELLENKKIFLSKKAVHSFGGYANQQLRRLDNKAARLVGQKQREQHILNVSAKFGKRNQHAIEHGKLGKHMMHLIRLYMMCLDILERGEIITYREKEHDFLMEIRNGKYLDDNRQPIPEFFEIVDEYEKKLNYAKENTDLPDAPDYDAIKELCMDVNERVVRGSV